MGGESGWASYKAKIYRKEVKKIVAKSQKSRNTWEDYSQHNKNMCIILPNDSLSLSQNVLYWSSSSSAALKSKSATCKLKYWNRSGVAQW